MVSWTWLTEVKSLADRSEGVGSIEAKRPGRPGQFPAEESAWLRAGAARALFIKVKILINKSERLRGQVGQGLVNKSEDFQSIKLRCCGGNLRQALSLEILKTVRS